MAVAPALLMIAGIEPLVTVVPLWIWSCYLLKTHWSNPFFTHRRPWFLFLQINFICFWMLVTGPLHALGYFAFKDSFDSYFNTWTLLYYCIIGPLMSFVMSLYLTQIWLLHYDIQLAQVIKNKHWRMVIDPINNNEFSNWFVKHKTVYGNAKKIVICCLIIKPIKF